MSLSQLPFELLKDIFSYLDDQEHRLYADHGYPALCAVALTCRRVSGVAVNILYADIELVFNATGAKDIERLVLLNRSCRENPSVVNRILRAHLYSSFGDAVDLYNEFLSHLAGSTSLTTLKTEIHGKWTALQTLYNYHEGSFAQVRHLEIGLHRVMGREWYLPAEQVTRLCELPSLEILTTHAPLGGFRTEESRPTATLANLKHLHLFASRPVSAAVLESILPRAPNMECVQLSVPGAATEVDRKMADNASMLGYDLSEPLRPAFYGELLAPAAASLKNLVIDTVNVKYPSHDGSWIDLSPFANLSRLEFSASLFFGTGKTASCAWSRGIGRYLPPRIESLHVLFDGDQGIFWSLGDMRRHARSRTFPELWQQRLNVVHVEWLIDLLAGKRKDATSLKSITVAEDPVVDRDQNWKVVHWHMTDYLNAVAHEAGVKLTMKLRVPRLFESPEIELCENSWSWGEQGTVGYGEYDEEGEAQELEGEMEE
ncbi:hypothetical protein Hte_002287 [Hypoxylon texense]